MAIIKSDSYGHLLNNVVQDIDDIVDGYGVVRLDEALSIRKISSKKILDKYKTIDVLSKATYEDLVEIVSPNIARKIFTHFNGL